MNLHVGVVAHTIPYPTGIAIPAVVVLAIKQSVFVAYCLLDRHAGITMSTGNIFDFFFFHFFFGFFGLCIGKP